MSDFESLVRGLRATEGDQPKLAPDVVEARLKSCHSHFQAKHKFKPGMIVTRRQECALYKPRFFGPYDLAIILEILPVPPSDQPGRGHYLKDLHCGFIGPDGSMMHVSLSSRFMEPAIKP